MATARLKVGEIGFINTLPVYWGLKRGLVEHPSTLVPGTPSELNGMLRKGELDISVISSVEYALAHESYLLLPGFSIAASGAVGSVLFFSRRAPEELGGQKVLLTDSSATSCALLRVLLTEIYRASPKYEVGPTSDAGVFRDGFSGVLAIGDEALRLAGSKGEWSVMDLGSEWRRITGLPFVFALWAVRRSLLDEMPGELARFLGALRSSRDEGLARLPEIAREVGQRVGLSPSRCLEYYQGLTYRLGEEELKGLRLFFDYLEKTGIIGEKPRIRFFHENTGGL